MQKIYNENGLPFWNERDIDTRDHLIKYFAREIRDALLDMNPAWSMHRIEAPCLMPAGLINLNYGPDDIFMLSETYDNSVEDLSVHRLGPVPADPALTLRPETTAGSYEYAKLVLNNHSGVKPPFVVWQAGKSFRRETDHVEKHMRLKEFYQQEFQCFYSADTENDYQVVMMPKLKAIFERVIKTELRIIDSDRLPSYSKKTIDIEAAQEFMVSTFGAKDPTEWMELCSVSVRTDFTEKAKFTTKKGTIEKELLVLEIAIGLDRCVYNS